METRFAQAFSVYLDNGGNVNDANVDDPVMNTEETTAPGAPITPGPFKRLSMNCRSCHLVDDVLTTPGGSMRAYADFARRSPIPDRGDGLTHTPRNSPPLVNAALDRPDGVLLHFDTEFNSIEDLIAGTFTGRNFGWLPGEQAQAIAHVARVVRGDDGSGVIAQQFDGLSYGRLFTGTNPNIPDEFRLPPEYRILVGNATDQEIFNAVIQVVAAYVNGLRFGRPADNGTPIRSPFDVFLEINGLPQQPNPNESPIDYSRRLLTLINRPNFSPQFVTSNPNTRTGQFDFHPGQSFTFGATELDGLKIFLTEPAAIPASPAEQAAGRIGNCLACHPAPDFTDFKLHNTGIAQNEYDDPSIGAGHAPGSFAALSIPTLAARVSNDLPATEQHPTASGRFRSIPTAGTTLTDLGVWNIFANPDMPNPQAKIRAVLCDDQVPCPLSDATLLDRAIARFKTPGLRDLGHSQPYMHTGQFDTVDSAVGFYIGSSNLARAGSLRNEDLQLQGIALTAGDVPSLVAFLKSLNEDYQ
ncbi:MAG TPA: hypothetical protein VJ746_08845 [Nitrospira sp.]|nr:hypothetical protein [Nitrospira sp.]